MLRAPFVLIWNVLKLLSYGFKSFFFRLGHFLTRKKKKWVRLKLPKTIPFGPSAGLAAHFQDKLSYIELREHIDTLVDDPKIDGVIVTADQLLHGAARTSDLRALIARLRRAEKSIIFHTHSIRGRDFALATAADEILMTPGGRFYLFGHRFEQYFAGGLLDKVGVAAQFVHIGPFKTAAHRFTKRGSTPSQRLMMEQLVGGLSDLREERVQQERELSDETLQKCFERMPLDDRQAEAFGLVDGRIHRRFLARWINENSEFIDSPAPSPGVVAAQAETAASDGSDADLAPPSDAPPTAEGSDDSPAVDSEYGAEVDDYPDVSIKDARSYADARPHYHWTPLFRPRRRVATVDLSGMIMMPGTEVPGQSLTTIDPDEVLPVLRNLATDPYVAAVVLHINSPGGSALASELLWDGIRRLRYEKPTIAYCSDIAASGGYYMAVAADRIVCQPETVTGSIGVVAGKFSVPGVFEKLEIGAEAFQRHETSSFESLSEPLSEKVLDNLKRDARSFYRQFLRRVGDSRKLPRRRLHRYARGRVYTGTDAHRRFLVDHLGGFDDAVEIARSLAEPELDASAPVSFHAHRSVSFPALLRQSAAGPSLTSLSETLSDAKLLHSMAKKDPLLALMPYRFDEIS